MSNTKFFTFIQNNSGGSFNISIEDGICEYVIIEALDHNHANARALLAGLYFDGCEAGIDCSCCGDRWYKASASDAEKEPMIYNTPINNVDKSWSRERCFIHYLNGEIKEVVFKEEKTDA